MFRVVQIFNEMNGFDFINVVKAPTAQDVAQNDLIALKARNALFHGRIDNLGVFGHVLRRARSRLPGTAPDLFGTVLLRRHGVV